MAAHDPPWRLDPFKNIVGVGWGSAGFVALTFSATARTAGEEGGGTPGNPISVNPVASISGVGSFSIFGGDASSKIARNPRAGYHKETNKHTDPKTTSSSHYLIHTSYVNENGSGSAESEWYVTVVGSDSFWSGFPFGTDHVGGLDDVIAFVTFGGHSLDLLQLISTETSTSSPKDEKSLEDAGVLIISVSAVRKEMADKDATSFTIEFDSGFSPGVFSWGTSISTYRKVTFASFPVDDKDKPVNWPESIDTDGDGGHNNKTVRFEIDFKTLDITRTSGSSSG